MILNFTEHDLCPKCKVYTQLVVIFFFINFTQKDCNHLSWVYYSQYPHKKCNISVFYFELARHISNLQIQSNTTHKHSL